MTTTVNELAFVFPGQGSQSVGMLADAFEQFPVVRGTFDQASEVLGLNASELALSGPQQQLNRTEITQPLLLCASVALWRVWCELSEQRPGWLAGHSLGEYSALVCAEALSFEDALGLVQLRGQLMQAAVAEGEGAMAAILGLDDAQVEQACEQACEGAQSVSAANYNSPGQVVIAGHAAAVERAIVLAKDAGAKRAMALAVSVPSHCELMRPAAEQLADTLANTEFAACKIPVIHNVDVSPAGRASDIRQRLAQQLHSPVRWSDSVQYLASQGVTTLAECGPGKVLSGLARRIDRNLSGVALEPPADLQDLANSQQT